jgi:ankyrin repeat protein
MVQFLPSFDREAALKRIFDRLHETADYKDVDFSDINACSLDGDNALHCVVLWEDQEAAEILLEAGIDVNKAGDLGYSPLHVACMKGNSEMVKLLVNKGADLFALSEGDSPFTSARKFGHDPICDLLAPLMKKALEQDPNIWARSRIDRLKREIANLEAMLKDN